MKHLFIFILMVVGLGLPLVKADCPDPCLVLNSFTCIQVGQGHWEFHGNITNVNGDLPPGTIVRIAGAAGDMIAYPDPTTGDFTLIQGFSPPYPVGPVTAHGEGGGTTSNSIGSSIP